MAREFQIGDIVKPHNSPLTGPIRRSMIGPWTGLRLYEVKFPNDKGLHLCYADEMTLVTPVKA